MISTSEVKRYPPLTLIVQRIEYITTDDKMGVWFSLGVQVLIDDVYKRFIGRGFEFLHLH